MLKAERIQSIN